MLKIITIIFNVNFDLFRNNYFVSLKFGKKFRLKYYLKYKKFTKIIPTKVFSMFLSNNITCN